MSNYNKSKNFLNVRLPSLQQSDESLFEEVSNVSEYSSQSNKETPDIPEKNETGNKLRLCSFQEHFNPKSRTLFGQLEEDSLLDQARKIPELYPTQVPIEKFKFTDWEPDDNQCFEFLKKFGNTNSAFTDDQSLTRNDSEIDNRRSQTCLFSQPTSPDIPLMSLNNLFMSKPIHFASQQESQNLNQGNSVTKHMKNHRSASFNVSQNSTGNTITTEPVYFQSSAMLPHPYVEDNLKTLAEACDMFIRHAENTSFSQTHSLANKNMKVNYDTVRVAGNDHNSKTPYVEDNLKILAEPCEMLTKHDENTSFAQTHSLANKNMKVIHDTVSDAGNDHNSKNPSTSYSEFHSQGSRYECQTRSNRFASFLGLQMHLNVHKQEVLFRCHKCGLAFTQPSQLKDHNENPVKCDICCKTFKQRAHLYRHMKIHTGEKLYKCVTCSRAFTRNDHLISHMRIHS